MFFINGLRSHFEQVQIGLVVSCLLHSSQYDESSSALLGLISAEQPETDETIFNEYGKNPSRARIFPDKNYDYEKNKPLIYKGVGFNNFMPPDLMSAELRK